MRTAIISTDAGRAYIKAMGNPEGENALACEWVGTQLAKWFGLPTFDFAILNLDDDDEIPLKEPYDGRTKAASGPAFVTRAAGGQPWGGSVEELDLLENLDDLSRLVVFDTWTLNCDRYMPSSSKAARSRYDNVFFSSEGAPEGKFKLIAMDHTHCFTCGATLKDRLKDIDRIKDEKLYGLFPQFVRRDL